MIPAGRLAVGLLLAGALAAAPGGSWKLQYFYDRSDSDLTLLDLRFASATHGVATGYVTQGGKVKPALLLTEDGGVHWSLEPLKELGVALFLWNEKLGWMATSKRIRKTEDGGRTWRKHQDLRDVQAMYFVSAERGWAVAARKKIYETSDGGVRWTEVPAASLSTSRPETTTYGWIEFANSTTGLITGWSQAPRADAEPDWVVPESAVSRREIPRLSIVLETRDGGKTWNSSTTSIFGRLTRVRLSPKGFGLGLIEFTEAFEWPSEVYRIEWASGGKSTRAYREKDRVITDMALVGDGRAYLAGIEKTSRIPNSPIPGKLKVLESSDLSRWQEMPADYRATARRAVFAAVDEDHVWIATDTGMILRLANTR